MFVNFESLRGRQWVLFNLFGPVRYCKYVIIFFFIIPTLLIFQSTRFILSITIKWILMKLVRWKKMKMMNSLLLLKWWKNWKRYVILFTSRKVAFPNITLTLAMINVYTVVKKKSVNHMNSSKQCHKVMKWNAAWKKIIVPDRLSTMVAARHSLPSSSCFYRIICIFSPHAWHFISEEISEVSVKKDFHAPSNTYREAFSFNSYIHFYIEEFCLNPSFCLHLSFVSSGRSHNLRIKWKLFENNK